MTIWEKLHSLNRHVVYLIFIIVTVIPTLYPVPMEVEITEHHRTIYEFIESLEPGDIVYMSVEYSAGTMGELHPPFVAITKHLIRKNIKAIFCANSAEAVPFSEKLVNLYIAAGKQYGVDVVNLGFVPGEEQAITALAENFEKTVAKDFYGRPIKELPLMNEIHSAKEAKIIIQNSAGGLGPLGWIRQVGVPYGTPIATVVSQVMMPSAMPYYQSGQLVGVGAGLRFAAEYETLLGEPGSGMAGLGAETTAHIYFAVLVVLGNIGWLVMNRKEKGGKN